MHASANEIGRRFFELYWQGGFKAILDVGSLDVNGSLRAFASAGARYHGIDLMPGNGVDQVLEDAYKYPFPDGSMDMVVSTSCFEHDEMFWLTFLEMARVVSDRGFIYINAPSRWTFHHPPDRWRFYPDAASALEKWGQRSGIPIRMVETFLALSDIWGDNVMVFTKREEFIPQTYICDATSGAEWSRKGSAGPLQYHDSHYWITGAH
jgi:SAM-dependent methyltransferase